MKIIKLIISLFKKSKRRVHDYTQPHFTYDLAMRRGDNTADLFGVGANVKTGDVLILDTGNRNRFIVEQIEYISHSTWKAKVKRM